MSLTPSRRTVVRTAAWSVPAVTVATAAPAFAVSSTYGTADATTFGYTSPYGPFDITVSSSHVPVTAPAGAAIDAPQFTAVIVIPESLVTVIRETLMVTSIDGTATVDYTGAGTEANLTIANAPVPAAGDMTLTASGVGQPSVSPSSDPVNIDIGQVVANMMLNQGMASSPFPITLDPTSPPNTLHTYNESP